MMTKHTTEPWTMEFHGHVLSADKSVVARAFASNPAMGFPGAISEDGRTANARRIVACVNACAGIPTEALETLLQLAATDSARLAALSLEAVLTIRRERAAEQGDDR